MELFIIAVILDSETELNSSTKNRVSCIRVLAGCVFVYVFSCIY